MKHQFEWHITKPSRELETRRGRICGRMFSRHSKQPEIKSSVGIQYLWRILHWRKRWGFPFYRMPLLSIGRLRKLLQPNLLQPNWPCDRNTDHHLGSRDLAPSCGRQMSHFKLLLTCCNFAAGQVEVAPQTSVLLTSYLDTMTHSAVNYWLFTSNKCPPSCECVV